MKITFAQWIELKNIVLKLIKNADILGMDKQKKELEKILNKIKKMNHL